MNFNEFIDMDSYIALSWINAKLRDEYDSLDSLCDDLEFNRLKIDSKFKDIDYIYDKNINQYR